MTISIEQEIDVERRLIKQLSELGWKKISLPNDRALLSNLKSSLEALNETKFSDDEFDRILSHMGKGSKFEIARRLFLPIQLTRKQNTCYVNLIDSEKRDRNRYQVTSQVTQVEEWQNRYDITLLINGIPLIHIELKRSGVELNAAYRQVWDYATNSYNASRGLYKHVKIFVISNDANTRYFANEYKLRNLKQTYYWTDKDNTPVNRLSTFTDLFLDPKYVFDTITNYMIFHDGNESMMVLRPYQRFAVEKILECVKHNLGSGYIWHTTGSGKTLTSFKAAQLIIRHTDVKKVIFIVDRADLDYQTVQEFKVYEKDSSDGTKDVHSLVQQLNSMSSNLIVTTIQKLNLAVSNDGYMQEVSTVRSDKVVLIFDECHRSQFGEMHANILRFFKNSQIFGFTGTPIFPENAATCITTEDRFGKLLHRYSVTEAIRDQNVLPFSVEYYSDGADREDDESICVSRELLESKSRISKIAKQVTSIHNKKTHHRKYCAIMCVSSTAVASVYYEIFRNMRKDGDHDLNVATIFSFSEEEDTDDGALSMPNELGGDFSSNRDTIKSRLQSHVDDYNKTFNTTHSIRDRASFRKYGNDISDRMKMRDEREKNAIDKGIDILIVVNMFLTGFDARGVNTLYVDKNLQFHGLLQAFSRTNRIYERNKSHGNIVCFRNLKHKVDEAIALFSRNSDSSFSLVESFEDVIGKFNNHVKDLLKLVDAPDAVDLLSDEEAKMKFVRKFRKVIRGINVLKTFRDFSFQHLIIDQKTFSDFTSKYLDIHRQFSRKPRVNDGVGGDDVDFELELIRRDEINVSYILNLLANIAEVQSRDVASANKKMEEVKKLIEFEPSLSNCAHLLKDFIEISLPELTSRDDTMEAFYVFLHQRREEKVDQLCHTYGIERDGLERLLSVFHIRSEGPLRTEVESAFVNPPGVMELKGKVDHVIEELHNFILIFGLPARVDGDPC